MIKYRKEKQIGEGTYGVVYRAIEIETNKVVALKKIKILNRRDGVNFTAVREIKILQEIKHQNIIGVGGSSVTLITHDSCSMFSYTNRMFIWRSNTWNLI
jgi:serine/threonine protein kinase